MKLDAVNAISLDMKLSFARIKVNNKKQMLRLLMERRKTIYLWLHVSLALNQVGVGSLTMVVLTK